MPEGDQAFSTIAFTDSSFSPQTFGETDSTGNDWHLDVTHNEIKPESLYQYRILGSLGPLFRSLSLSTLITTVTFSKDF
ncbi:MAG: hypothetical protein ACLS3V_00640 [Streptococcus sp.]